MVNLDPPVSTERETAAVGRRSRRAAAGSILVGQAPDELGGPSCVPRVAEGLYLIHGS